MKKFYFVALLSFLFLNLQAQNFDWAKREGHYAYDYGYGITTDNTGNVYVAGKYEEVNADFSDTILPCAGNHDIFLAQYSSAGVLNWIRTAGGTSGDYAWGVSCDNAFLYIAGEIEGVNETIYFPGSPITLTCEASNDIFVAKYDLSGNLIWAERAGGSGYEKALSVTHDEFGNVYICGEYQNSITFGGTTTINVTTVGENDIFVAKYDMNGVFQWVQHAGGPGRDEAKSIKYDGAGNLYICGLYKDGCVFGSTTYNASGGLGYMDAFVAKYAVDGTLLWVKTAGGDYDDVAWSLTLDNAGMIYVTGEFNAYAAFGSLHLTTTGNADVFVACYNPAGTLQWAKSAGGPLIDRARGIGTDGTNLYITGQFGATANFGPVALSSADSSDVFAVKLNNAGTFISGISIGGPADAFESLGYESGIAICADPTGIEYATGAILDGGVFGTASYGPYARTDVFVTRISNGPDITSPLAVVFSPVDNSTSVPVNSNLILTFNEAVQKGSGNILIKEGGVLTQTIDVLGSNVVVSGNNVTINPAVNLNYSALVDIEIAPGVIRDMAGNNYGGIAGATTWNFTVIDTTVVTPTNIAKTNTLENFNIYPNPGTGNFTLGMNQRSGQKIETTIFNYLGEVVNKRTENSAPELKFDLSSEAKGVYFIEIKTEDQRVSRGKIIIQ